MTANSDAEKYLNYYLDSKTKPDFGILLDGPWGCGKTHFIDDFLKKRNVAARQSDPLSDSVYLYASLYGVRSRDEITEQFFVQSHPVLSSRPMQVIGSSVAGLLRKVGLQISESGKGGATVKEIVLDLTGKILVFDDLERSAMPISEVMGFINSFVEHRHLKVIVIANQNEIPNNADYQLKKEKLIGKTLKVTADADEVFAHFITEIQSEAAKAAALRSKDDVIKTFLASGKSNYRSLRAILEDFDRLVSAVDYRLQGSAEGIHKLLIYMMATGMAYRSTSISAADLAELNSMVMRVRMDLSRTADKSQFESAKNLMSTYPNVDWSNPVILPSDLTKVYETGIIDVDAINEHLCTHPLIVGQTNAPPWRQLWDWTDLTRTEYVAARAALLEELSAYEITHPGVLMHVAGIIVCLAEFGDEMLGNSKQIVKFFESYTKKLISDKKLEPRRGVFAEIAGGYGSLGYQGTKSPGFKEVHEIIKQATLAAFAIKISEEATDFLGRLKSDSEGAYSALYEYDENKGNYADVPILENIPIPEFAELFIIDSKPNDRLFASLSTRYDHDRHTGALKNEHGWVGRLHTELLDRIAKETPPFKEILEMRVKHNFDKITEAIKTVV